MKVSVTYLYTIFRYGYPHTIEETFKSLFEIRDLGFRYLEMEGLGSTHLRSLYKRRKELGEVLNQTGVHVHNFCVVNPELVSLNRRKRAKAYKQFKLGAALADFVGAETLHLASYAPPVRYIEAKPYQLNADEGYQFFTHARVSVPAKLNWEEVWEALVESCRFCADAAAGYGKTIIMEPRVGEVICSVDSLLRLIQDVGRANFKANFDTAHFSAQRENVPLALVKLRGKFANVHLADNDPADAEHLPLGEGIIDWLEFFRLLKSMRYDGYLGLDLGVSRPLIPGYRKSIRLLKSLAGQLRFPLEW